MTKNETKVLKIYRQLTPDGRISLFNLVRLAYFAENSARKIIGIDAVVDGVSISKPRGYPCGNLVQRSKK
jgi:hypothetical protein